MNAPLPPQPAQVWCRSESRYAERPTAFVWEGQRVEVQHILAQWREPAGPGFRVLATNRGIYTLQYDEASQTWRITEHSTVGNTPAHQG